MVHRTLLVGLVLLVGVGAASGGVTINHANFDPSGLSQDVMNQIGQLKIFFAHASVGGNMIGGMSDLRTQNATRYQLQSISDDATPPAALTAGRVYEYQRGNPGWQLKVSYFEDYMANGWGDGRAGIVMNKFCYVDEDAGFTTYRDSMVALEAAYANARFVYMTVPLMETCGADGYLRQVFNEQLRAFCAANNKILFDIADIEAWSPTGVEQTVVYNSHVCQVMYDGYSEDGGHLYNVAYSGEPYSGRVRVAMGLYSLYGELVPEPSTMALVALGGLALLRKRRAR